MGSRDLLLKDQRIIVFVNDCFWYRHRDCQDNPAYHQTPSFWISRAKSLRRRNLKTFKKLTLKGWTVVMAWSCQNKGEINDKAGPRRYLPEYLKTIYKELTRLTLLLIK